MANADIGVKLLLEIQQRGKGAKDARSELKAVKKEADALKGAGGPDKLDRSLVKTSVDARRLAADLAKAKAEAKALGATDARPKGLSARGAGAAAYAPLKDMASPKSRVRSLLGASAGGAMAAGASGMGLAGMVGAGGAAMLGVKATREALSFEKAMYDVSRATDVSGAALENYGKQVVALSLATGKAAPELAGMLAAAGFAGRPKQELMDFTKYAAKAMTAWGTGAEQTGQALAEIGNIYQANQRRIEEIGDAINTAADASAAKETDLMEVLRRAGAAGRQVGVGAEATLAFAGALKEVGTQPEVIGTSLNALYTNLALGDDATKEFSEGLASIKTNAKALQASVRKDATGAIVDLLKKIEKVPDGLKRMEILKKLFGREYADNMGALLNNLPRLTSLLELMGKKKNYAGSVTRDMDKKLLTDFNRLERAEQSIAEMMRRIGEPLKIVAGAFAEAVNGIQTAHDTVAAAKAKAEAIAQKIVDGKALTPEEAQEAAKPDSGDRIEGLVADKKEDRRNISANERAEIAQLEAEIAALQKSIEARQRAGAPLSQTEYSASQVVEKKRRLHQLRPEPHTRGPADAEERSTIGGMETKARLEYEKRAKDEMDRLKRLRDMAPDGPARKSIADKISESERGEGGHSLGQKFKADQAAKLKAALTVDMQPAGALMSEQFAAGIKSGQSHTDGAAQGIGEGIKNKLSAVEAGSAAQKAMADYAAGITAHGASAVAAAQGVAQRVAAALTVKGGAGVASVRSRLSNAQHDGIA